MKIFKITGIATAASMSLAVASIGLAHVADSMGVTEGLRAAAVDAVLKTALFCGGLVLAVMVVYSILVLGIFMGTDVLNHFRKAFGMPAIKVDWN